MAFLKTLDAIRTVDWSRGYLWDAKFLSAGGRVTSSYELPPAPFDEWFPATDYDEVTRTGNSLMLNYYNSVYKFPQSTANIDITMSYIDNVNHDLFYWIKDWYDDIYNKTEGTAVLEDIVRPLMVAKLNLDRSILKVVTFLVYPDQTLQFGGGSMSESKSHNVNFVVAGTIE